jgi:hypothetical protein
MEKNFVFSEARTVLLSFFPSYEYRISSHNIRLLRSCYLCLLPYGPRFNCSENDIFTNSDRTVMSLEDTRTPFPLLQSNNLTDVSFIAPDLVPCDFFMVRRIKSQLRQRYLCDLPETQ